MKSLLEQVLTTILKEYPQKEDIMNNLEKIGNKLIEKEKNLNTKEKNEKNTPVCQSEVIEIDKPGK